MSLNKSIYTISKRLDYLDNGDGDGIGNNNGDNNNIRYWKGKKIIPLSE
jgi:hypothetical protein